MSDVNLSPLVPAPEAPAFDATLRHLLQLEIPLADAVRVALGRRYGLPSYKVVPAFADRHGLNRTNTATALASQRPAPDDLLAALVVDLGGTADVWRELLWLAARPEPRQAVA